MEIRHNQANGNYNHVNHPGNAPTYTDPSELTFYDKMMDKSSSTYHIQADDGRLLPIKKGNIQWNDTVKFCNYIDVFFQPNAIFTKQENWEQRMRKQFED